MKVGKQKIIFSNVFLVPDGEEAEFEYALSETDLLKCRLKFIQQEVVPGEEKKALIKSDLIEGEFVIQFINFHSSLGHSLNAPITFGISDIGEAISFNAAVYKFQTLHKIEMQVMLGDKK